jgi:hypothetical protein
MARTAIGTESAPVLRLHWIDCGKVRCRKLHGPYWYAHWTVKLSARRWKTRSKYIGTAKSAAAFLAAHPDARQTHGPAIYPNRR